jgi:DNA-binding LacI/PurR family transcriptional regulator
VSSETRARILAAAARLGYQPNALARGLITQRSGMIGIVVSDINNPFLSDALERLSRRLRDSGLRVLLITASSVKDIGAAAPELEQYRVDGCFVICPHLSRGFARSYGRLGTTVLLFNRHVPGLKASSVSVDSVAAGRRVADHLTAMGHRTIGYLHGTKGSATDHDRFVGFSSRLGELGIDPPKIGWADYTYYGGYRALPELMAQSPVSTAVFCANDIMAMGAMDAARSELKLNVPGDLSIVGFDDAPSAAWPGYALTTVRQPVSTVVEIGVEMMLAKARETPSKPVKSVLNGELIVRGSTAPP